MATLRKGTQATALDHVDGATTPTSGVFEVSDSVGSLTLYGIFEANGGVGTVLLETAPTETFGGAWAKLAQIQHGNPVTPEATEVAFAAGQVLFVRVRVESGFGQITAIVVAR